MYSSDRLKRWLNRSLSLFLSFFSIFVVSLCINSSLPDVFTYLNVTYLCLPFSIYLSVIPSATYMVRGIKNYIIIIMLRWRSFLTRSPYDNIKTFTLKMEDTFDGSRHHLIQHRISYLFIRLEASGQLMDSLRRAATRLLFLGHAKEYI